MASSVDDPTVIENLDAHTQEIENDLSGKFQTIIIIDSSNVITNTMFHSLMHVKNKLYAIIV